jgi:hypothetical protein
VIRCLQYSKRSFTMPSSLKLLVFRSSWPRAKVDFGGLGRKAEACHGIHNGRPRRSQFKLWGSDKACIPDKTHSQPDAASLGTNKSKGLLPFPSTVSEDGHERPGCDWPSIFSPCGRGVPHGQSRAPLLLTFACDARPASCYSANSLGGCTPAVHLIVSFDIGPVQSRPVAALI